jgi:hypothetical protein
MIQMQLNLSERANRRKMGPKLAARMIAMLTKRGGWTTRGQFRDILGLKDRECRLGRECSHGRIIAGQKGYKLIKQASCEEIHATLATIRAQIRAEQEQHRMIMKRAYQQLNRSTP